LAAEAACRVNIVIEVISMFKNIRDAGYPVLQKVAGCVQRQLSKSILPRKVPEQKLVYKYSERSDIYLIKHTDGTDDGVGRLIALMKEHGLAFYRTAEAPDGLIGPNDVVLLKYNCQWDKRGGTNVDLIESVIKAVCAHPEGFTGEVIVGDNGSKQFGPSGKGGRMDWQKANGAQKDRSVADMLESLKPKLRVSGSLWDNFTLNEVKEFSDGDMADGFVVEPEILASGLQVSYPKFTTEFGTRVSFKRGIWDEAAGRYDGGRLKVINMPVLKSHILYQATGAIKCYMGTTSAKLTHQRSHNSIGNGGMGAQMACTRMPALNLMDMIYVGLSNGPGVPYDDAVQLNMIAASTDPAALDYWCMKNVLKPEIAKTKYGNALAVDPDGILPGQFGYWLRLSANELNRRGFTASYNWRLITAEGAGRLDG
jgi:uncharacterized protein (DUF362 family)